MATRETPFNLVYGVEAVIPLKIEEPSLRIEHFDPSENDARMEENVDLLEEIWERADLKVSCFKKRLVKYYNMRVQTRVFFPRDLVLRKIEASDPQKAVEKLAPN